jgi:hypothetical protein
MTSRGWIVLVTLAGCGGGSTAPDASPPVLLDNAPSPAELTELCERLCDFTNSCPGPGDASCVASCTDYGMRRRADAVARQIDCIIAEGCGGSAGCRAAAIVGLEPTAETTWAFAACQATGERCDFTCGMIDDGIMWSDATLDAITACYDLPCDQIGDCTAAATGIMQL